MTSSERSKKYAKIFLIILFFYLSGIIITTIHEIGHLLWGYMDGCKDASIEVYFNFHGVMNCNDPDFKSGNDAGFASSGFTTTTVVGAVVFILYKAKFKKNYLVSLFLFLLSFFSLSTLIYNIPVDSLLFKGDIVDILNIYKINNVLFSAATFAILLPFFYVFIKEFPVLLKNMKVTRKGEERKSVIIFALFIAAMIILMLLGF